MEYTTTVINLIGGPCCGKSTLAAMLYARMKRNGSKVEMVREVAKEWVWAGRKIGPFEQLAILGEQIHKESALYGKVEYVVTDSPVLLGAFYLDNNHDEVFAKRFVKDFYNFSKRKGVRYINVVLPRKDLYQQDGRLETHDQAKELDFRIMEYLEDDWYDYTVYPKVLSDEQIITRILEQL